MLIKLALRELIHPLLIKILKKQKMPKIDCFNNCPVLNNCAIYVANHSCRYDIPIVALSIQKHVYILGGKQNLNFLISFFQIYMEQSG